VRLSIDPSHPSYPSRLLELDPYVLRVEGELTKAPGVAIVGTRTPTADAVAFARQLATDLAEQGLVIWSGGALGIDTAAHQGALDVGKPTVAVLGSGLDHVFPPENAEFFRDVVAAGGALVSLLDDREQADRHHFLRRNRVLAGATEMTIVVECDHRSGARSAARNAHELRRPLGVVLQGPWLSWGAGCYLEYQLHGAQVIQSSNDVLKRLGLDKKQLSLDLDVVPRDKLSDLERSVVRAVASGHSNLDDLCEALSLPAASVCALVMDLTLRGHLLETSRGLRPA
jgi:DNA processing protein